MAGPARAALPQAPSSPQRGRGRLRSAVHATARGRPSGREPRAVRRHPRARTVPGTRRRPRGRPRHPGAPRAPSAKERDRIVLPDAPPGTGFRVIVEFFLEAGDVGRITTYRLDLLKAPTPDAGWLIADFERLTGADGLFRLSLDRTRCFAVTGLRVQAEDFDPGGPAGYRLRGSRHGRRHGRSSSSGDGTMRFSPGLASERVQVRIFSGSETLVTPFTVVFLRLRHQRLPGVRQRRWQRRAGRGRPQDLPTRQRDVHARRWAGPSAST